MVDFAFLGAEGEREIVAVLVITGTKTNMVFAHVAPQRELAHEHGSHDLKDVATFGHREVILECGGTPALRSVREEVKRLREAPTMLYTSGVGDSQANSAAQRFVQSLGEQSGHSAEDLKPGWGSSFGALTF